MGDRSAGIVRSRIGSAVGPAAMGRAIELSRRLTPQPGAQRLFHDCDADIAILGGGAFGGKSYSLILEPTKHIRHKEFRAVAFRRESPQLRGPGGLWDEAKGLYGDLGAAMPKSPDMLARFVSGAEVLFSHLQYDDSVKAWDSSQIPMLIFDQLESFTEQQFWYMQTRNRDPSGKFKPVTRAACNPMPDSWLKRFLAWWIDEKTGYAILERSGVKRWMVRINDIIHWGASREELWEQFGIKDLPRDHPKQARPLSVTFILARIWDNKIGLTKDPAYVSRLMNAPRHERERLLGDEEKGGNWNVKPTAGLLFRREWCPVVQLEPQNVEWVRGWDLAATKVSPLTPDPDWTVGVRVGRYVGQRRFVIAADVLRIRENPAQVEKAMKDTAVVDGGAVRIRGPQDPGQAGKSQAAALTGLLAGYDVKFNPVTGDKVTRFSPFSAQAERGNVDLVDGVPEEFLRSLEGFPDLVHDDDADAVSEGFQALAGGELGEQVLAYFKSIGAGPQDNKAAVPDGHGGNGTNGGGGNGQDHLKAGQGFPGAADVVEAARAAREPAKVAPGSLRLQSAPHANFMWSGNDGQARRYTADAEGYLVAKDEPDALHLVKSGCIRVATQ